MREILFKGKTEYDKWVYGSLILAGSYCCILESEEDVHPLDYPYLCSDLGTIDGQATPVIPETICRLIEHPCYDSECSDRKFFEGDILSVRSRWAAGDETPDIAIVIDEHSILVNGLGRNFPQDTTVVDIIGNVYDNPELVGEKYVSRYLRDFAYGGKNHDNQN